jgi:Ni,Fe-hydrogenase I large subunit
MASPITTPVNGTTVIEVDPISRIEGHLGVKVQQSGGYVTEADVHGNMWRGFENFLIGRESNDAITFTQRICGVCPVPHGMTSTYAADTVLGYSKGHITFAYDGAWGVPKKAVHIRNLVLASEFLMSSLTHQYHLVAPSYVQGPAIPPWTPYFNDNFYHVLLRSTTNTWNLGSPYATTAQLAAPRRAIDGTYPDDLWSAVILSYVKALRVRRLTFEAGALFAGRMPMTSVFVAGGVTFDKAESLADRCDKFSAIMQEIALFIVKEYVPIFLALGALYPNYDNLTNAGITNTVTSAKYAGLGTLWAVAGNAVAPSAANTGYGAGVGRFLVWGAFPDAEDATATAALQLWGGVKTQPAAAGDFQVKTKADVESLFLATTGIGSVPFNLTESIANSHYKIYAGDTAAYTKDSGKAAYPGAVSRTQPKRADGYSYIKSPRWNGQPCEVGPFADMVVNDLYPTDAATALAAQPGLSTQFAKYLKGSGLNPAMIDAGVAVALLREGLAELVLTGGVNAGTYTYANVGPGGASASLITTLYTDPTAEIRGIIYAWVTNMVGGLSTMDRLRARALQSLVLVQQMVGDFNGTTFDTANSWIGKLKVAGGDTWRNLEIPVGEVQGWGGTQAPRGSLMHQVTIVNGKITKYQCIVPTTWNGSPKDAAGNRGPIEQAVVGTPYSTALSSFPKQNGTTGTAQGGVEALRAAQSFDPCIACAIH